MNKSQLRRQHARCREVLHDLEDAVDLGAIATIRQLCDALAVERRRPIYLEPRSLPPRLAAIGLATRTTDYIFYADDAPPVLQEHAIVHEVAHILLGRDARNSPDGVSNTEIGESGALAALAPQVILQALQCSCYADRGECEAEWLATLIEQRWRAVRRPAANPFRLPSQPDIRWLAEHVGQT